MFKPIKSDYMYGVLKDRIAAMSDGEPFPSVRKLMEEYGVSQYSLDPAFKKLQKQGYLVAVAGKRSAVNKSISKRSAEILLLTPKWDGLTVSQMHKAIADEVKALGFHFETEQYDPSDESVFAKLDKFGVDGIIFDPLSNDDLTAAQMSSIAMSATPVVLCCASLNIKGVSYANGNNTLAGVMIAEELAGKGHKDLVLFISEPQAAGNAKDTINGFLSQARRRGCRVASIDCCVKSGEDSVGKSRLRLERELASGPLPGSAMFALSYETAMAAAEALRNHGVRVPEELSLITFGSLKATSPGQPRISSVGHPMEKIAAAAAKILAAQLCGDLQAQSKVEIEPELFDFGTVKQCCGKHAAMRERHVVA